ncbi:hypothetical protein B0T19DRAFT_396804 [Cercophora scortea]|uniref:Uncharacterized protein n=1 Tax=Cercophora scortea TaxID=314031 RepID=A0AAE0MLR3_9PEZI|nr:hypothetical protein B0T19DRAFT_396804 [Cercophora scortea]
MATSKHSASPLFLCISFAQQAVVPKRRQEAGLAETPVIDINNGGASRVQGGKAFLSSVNGREWRGKEELGSTTGAATTTTTTDRQGHQPFEPAPGSRTQHSQVAGCHCVVQYKPVLDVIPSRSNGAGEADDKNGGAFGSLLTSMCGTMVSRAGETHVFRMDGELENENWRRGVHYWSLYLICV